jgi:hypothetical protein
MPDAGENEADNGNRFPSYLSKSGAIKKTADGFTYLDPAQFHEYFAADFSGSRLPSWRARMYSTRPPIQSSHHDGCVAKRAKLDGCSGK